MTAQTTHDQAAHLAHQAALGSRTALATLKAMFPRLEFRRFHCDLRGSVLKCRGKGSAGTWKRF